MYFAKFKIRNPNRYLHFSVKKLVLILGISYQYLGYKLFTRYFDICKDLRLKIPAIHSSGSHNHRLVIWYKDITKKIRPRISFSNYRYSKVPIRRIRIAERGFVRYHTYKILLPLEILLYSNSIFIREISFFI